MAYWLVVFPEAVIRTIQYLISFLKRTEGQESCEFACITHWTEILKEADITFDAGLFLIRDVRSIRCLDGAVASG